MFDAISSARGVLTAYISAKLATRDDGNLEMPTDGLWRASPSFVMKLIGGKWKGINWHDDVLRPILLERCASSAPAAVADTDRQWFCPRAAKVATYADRGLAVMGYDRNSAFLTAVSETLEVAETTPGSAATKSDCQSHAARQIAEQFDAASTRYRMFLGASSCVPFPSFVDETGKAASMQAAAVTAREILTVISRVMPSAALGGGEAADDDDGDDDDDDNDDDDGDDNVGGDDDDVGGGYGGGSGSKRSKRRRDNLAARDGSSSGEAADDDDDDDDDVDDDDDDDDDVGGDDEDVGGDDDDVGGGNGGGSRSERNKRRRDNRAIRDGSSSKRGLAASHATPGDLMDRVQSEGDTVTFTWPSRGVTPECVRSFDAGVVMATLADFGVENVDEICVPFQFMYAMSTNFGNDDYRLAHAYRFCPCPHDHGHDSVAAAAHAQAEGLDRDLINSWEC